MDCLKGIIPIQETIVNSNTMINGIQYGNVQLLPYHLIPLFYISLLLIILSSIINFIKVKEIKSGIILGGSIILVIYVLITHNYLWFLLLLNIYLFLYVLFDCCQKDKISICVICFSLVICFINIIKLVQHLGLEFSPYIDMNEFETALIDISKINLTLLALWIIAYLILETKEVILLKNRKTSFDNYI